ncbi:MAG: terpene cyclase/mutase family protein [Pirellulales bacterium]|nr:terpene cyclase/mutase family protein [Pirellulales bacterium]MBX3431996.1 terpene cyclase/mutase family protein [Pirellulales bacterium]
MFRMSRLSVASVFGLSLISIAWADAAETTPSAPSVATRGEMVDKAVAFLRGAQQPDGSFTPQTGPAVTALVAAGMLENGRSPDDPTVAKALAFVLKSVQPDGGIYQRDSNHRNYETCLSIMALAAANKDGRFAKQLDAAKQFLKDLQWDDGEGHDPSSDSYGGFGYGSHKRPDLSNTAFAAEALKVLQTDDDEESMQRLLAFVSKCQNLESEHNTSQFPALNPDGGFYYTIAAGGSSQAGSLPNGGLRSYGSMTYQGLKSMLYAGVDRNDPRVRAAVAWLAKHYTLEENPGMGLQGLYYYYHTLAKALAAYGEPTFVDDAGTVHDWRSDLTAALAERQHPDGSWFNDADRWLEGDPNLVTGYALMALAHCRE